MVKKQSYSLNCSHKRVSPVHLRSALYNCRHFYSGANLCPPGKPHQLEDSYSPYNLMSSSDSPSSPLVAPDSWGQGKSSSDKMANGTNINWPPGIL